MLYTSPLNKIKIKNLDSTIQQVRTSPKWPSEQIEGRHLAKPQFHNVVLANS